MQEIKFPWNSITISKFHWLGTEIYKTYESFTDLFLKEISHLHNNICINLYFVPHTSWTPLYSKELHQPLTSQRSKARNSKASPLQLPISKFLKRKNNCVAPPAPTAKHDTAPPVKWPQLNRSVSHRYCLSLTFVGGAANNNHRRHFQNSLNVATHFHIFGVVR